MKVIHATTSLGVKVWVHELTEDAFSVSTYATRAQKFHPDEVPLALAKLMKLQAGFKLYTFDVEDHVQLDMPNVTTYKRHPHPVGKKGKKR